MIRILFFLCFYSSLYGQKWVKTIGEDHGYPLGEKYLQVKDGHYFTIYFINTTNDDYKINAENGRMKPTAQIKDTNGDWKDIAYDGNPCLAPRRPFELMVPSLNFTWARYPKLFGDFETKMRFKVLVNDSIFYSNPFITSIDFYWTLDNLSKKVYQIERGGENKSLSKKEQSRTEWMIGGLLERQKKYKEALEKYDKAIMLDSTNNAARASKASFYISDKTACLLGANKEKIGLLSIAWREWEQISTDWEYYERIKYKMDTYYPFLPDKMIWEKENTFPTKVSEDGKILYYIACELNDYIEIEFKK